MAGSEQGSQRLRVQFAHQQQVRGRPEQIFPLLCPRREYDWIPGWSCRMVYSRCGFAEPDCVFQTGAGDATDTWVVSRYDPPRHIGFVRVDRWRAMSYEISLSPGSEGTVRLDWRQTVTALDAEGEAVVADMGEAEFAARIGGLERMLQHYLDTGEPLENSP